MRGLNHLIFSASVLALVTVAFAPGAAAHWGDTTGAQDPAGGANKDVPHHIYLGPGSVNIFDIPTILCFGEGPILGTHIGYNQANQEWHAVVSNDPITSGSPNLVFPDRIAAPVPGETLAMPPSQGGTTPTGEIVTPLASGPHEHHHTVGGPADGGFVVAEGDPLISDPHDSILAGDVFPLSGIGLVGEVRTPQQPSTGDISAPSTGACPGTEPAGAVTGGDPTTDPFPDNPTGAGLTFGLDNADHTYVDNRCLGFGDGDADLAYGGGFILYSVLPGDANSPALTGCEIPDPAGATGADWDNDGWGTGITPATCVGCGTFELGRVHDNFAEAARGGYAGSSTGGTTSADGGVKVADLSTVGDVGAGGTYTVCFDENDNGVCTTNQVSSPDAWDLCGDVGGFVDDVPVATQSVADWTLFFGGIIPDSLATGIGGYLAVDTTALDPITGDREEFFGSSVHPDTAAAENICWPKKDPLVGIGVSSAAGPTIPSGTNTDPVGIPDIPANQGDVLVMFTSTCVDAAPPFGSCVPNPSTLTAGWVGVNPASQEDLTVASNHVLSTGSLAGTSEPEAFHAGPVIVRHTSSSVACGTPTVAPGSASALGGAANTWVVADVGIAPTLVDFSVQCPPGGTTYSASWYQAN